MNLTPEQEKELRRVKEYFPYRIVWGMLNKDTKEFFCTANHTKRQMNKAVREGHTVFKL